MNKLTRKPNKFCKSPMNKIFFEPQFTNLDGSQTEYNTPMFYFEKFYDVRIFVDQSSQNCISSFCGF